MAWVVDTCVLLDVLEGDPLFGEQSVLCLEKCAADGLVVCPVTFIELAPAFLGDVTREMDFLDRLGADSGEDWTREDSRAAHRAWFGYVERRRGRKLPKRPLADILIGAFSMRFDGLITRNTGDFRSVFPELNLMEP